MLKTNLSTRPFYNERAVYWALALAFVAIVALTVFNVTRVVSLSARQGTLSGEVQRQEARIRDLNNRAAKVRGSIDQEALARVIAAAKEANAIIDERTFSWTELFNHLEQTVPAGVMLTSVIPSVKDNNFRVQLNVLGREVEQVDDFIEKLEATGAFSGMLASEERVTEEDQIEARIEGSYIPSVRAAGATTPVDEPPTTEGDPQAGPAASLEPNAAAAKGPAPVRGAS